VEIAKLDIVVYVQVILNVITARRNSVDFASRKTHVENV